MPNKKSNKTSKHKNKRKWKREINERTQNRKIMNTISNLGRNQSLQNGHKHNVKCSHQEITKMLARSKIQG
jgi:hypothetical protein